MWHELKLLFNKSAIAGEALKEYIVVQKRMQFSNLFFSLVVFPVSVFSLTLSLSFFLPSSMCKIVLLIAAGLPLLSVAVKQACRHCFSTAIPPVGVHTAPLFAWCITQFSTNLSCHHYNQSFQFSQADHFLLQSSPDTLTSGKEWPIQNLNHFSLPSQKKMENHHSRMPNCCQIILSFYILDRCQGWDTMSGKLKLSSGQAKYFPFIQHAFNRSYWLHAGDSLMLQRNVSLCSCRVFQSFPSKKT